VVIGKGDITAICIREAGGILSKRRASCGCTSPKFITFLYITW
jgi:hypothetical protein